MQVKKASSGIIQYRANRQLVQSHRRASREGVQVSNKEIVESASKIQVTRKEPVKPGQVLNPERVPVSPTPEEQAAIVFNTCYLEQQQQNGDSVSCFRSTGALPIPTRRCSTIVNGTVPRFPKARKTSMPEPLLRMADSIPFEPLMEETEELEPLDTPVRLRVSIATGPAISATTAEPPKTLLSPAKKPARPQCIKHSKCHCALFSQQISGFFDIAKPGSTEEDGRRNSTLNSAAPRTRR